MSEERNRQKQSDDQKNPKNLNRKAEKEELEDEINADAHRLTKDQMENLQDDMLQDEEKIRRETNQRSSDP